MPESSEIARLFDRRPKQWGAAGDPVVWDVLRDKICAVAPPGTAGEFAEMLRREFAVAVGLEIDDTGAEFVERAGADPVHLPTWRTILLPLLIVRARQLYGELPTERP
ncbi:hypothetical protein [Nocardia rhizosphaerae]|uniref:Uncharacterized protein n=1 Tax=Nocardia rhizosphaerae TaxID=1691571 RepID=A0ABV8LCQ7_9NOCA